MADFSAKEAPVGTGRRIFDAAKTGDVAALRPLVQQWSENEVLNWSNPDDNGHTPLVVASDEGYTEAVEVLLAAPGIRVNSAGGTGWTAINRAAGQGHIEIVRALLAAPYIDVNHAHPDG